MRILGLNSGTSIDALDWAVVECRAARPQVTVIASGSVSFPARLRTDLRKAAAAKTVDKAWLTQLDFDFGRWMASAARRLCAKHKSRRRIDLIASHGQTVGHWPSGIRSATLQIGDPDQIAKVCGLPVASHFRHGDIAAGGEGAPITPAINRILFSQPSKHVAILNLGGIANITFLPPRHSSTAPSGTDCGPANMLLDLAAHRLLKRAYDRNGTVASRGVAHKGMLAFMQRHPWLRRPLPASCGREEFGEEYLTTLMRKFPSLSAADRLATLCAFTASCVKRATAKLHAYPRALYLAGGGVHNKSLVRALKLAMAPIPVQSVADLGFDPNSLEAASFALLGYCCVHRLPLDLRGSTGAARPAVLGRIAWP